MLVLVKRTCLVVPHLATSGWKTTTGVGAWQFERRSCKGPKSVRSNMTTIFLKVVVICMAETPPFTTTSSHEPGFTAVWALTLDRVKSRPIDRAITNSIIVEMNWISEFAHSNDIVFPLILNYRWYATKLWKFGYGDRHGRIRRAQLIYIKESCKLTYLAAFVDWNEICNRTCDVMKGRESITLSLLRIP